MEKNETEYIEKIFTFKIPPGQLPERLDSYLTQSIRNATRTKVQHAIDSGNVTINGKVFKASRKIKPGDEIECKIMKPPTIELIPENIPLNVIFEDDFLLVVNKPPGMVAHPAFGNRQGTLVNAVLYHLGMRESIKFEEVGEEIDDEDHADLIDDSRILSSDAVRPGIVHRLDKDTSGLLVIAKNPQIHAKLALQFSQRTVDRFYNALVWGTFENDKGIIEGDIGRSSRDRKLFSVVKKDGKPAKTEYKVLKRFEYLTLLQVKLWTGRTHQIRVHLSHENRPVFGDPSYGGNKLCYGGNNPEFRKKAEALLKMTSRQLLHARTLGFIHPITNEKLNFESELPEDFKEVLMMLE